MAKAMRTSLLRNLAVVLLFTGCATSSFTTTIDQAIARPPFHRAFWSILVEDDQGRVLYAHNEGKLTIPASNRKLFAAATIATCLGTTTQLSTDVFRDGEDVVIRGDGDPSLGSWRYERDADFDSLAQSLRARGITRVRDVIADVSAFDRVTIPGGWKYGNLGSDYSASVDALSWGENEIPVDRAVPDPGLHAATVLREALIFHGIEVTGVARVNTERHEWTEKLASLPSPFVGQLLTTVLKNSHNLYTEMLFKRASGGTYDRSFALDRAFLMNEPKLEGNAFRFVDGSGLAPDDLVTPQSTIRMLRWMNDPVRRAFWWDVLAQPNQDGTLRRRIVTLEHRFRGKTGTINGVNALSGIVAMPDGRFRYFAIVVNHHAGESSEAVRILDEVAEFVASFGVRPARSY